MSREAFIFDAPNTEISCPVSAAVLQALKIVRKRQVMSKSDLLELIPQKELNELIFAGIVEVSTAGDKKSEYCTINVNAELDNIDPETAQAVNEVRICIKLDIELVDIPLDELNDHGFSYNIVLLLSTLKTGDKMTPEELKFHMRRLAINMLPTEDKTDESKFAEMIKLVDRSLLKLIGEKVVLNSPEGIHLNPKLELVGKVIKPK